METISRTKARALLATKSVYGRYRQLALAYLIGMPYRRVEFTTRGNNVAVAGVILSALHDRWWEKPLGEREALHAHAQAWLLELPTPELVKKNQDAREAFLARKKANTERILAERAAE